MYKHLKKLYAAVLVICVMFAVQLISDSGKYHSAVADIAGGEYESALTTLEELGTYRDSEVLAEYCRIMAEYNSYDYASVCRSYHRLKALDIDNEALAVSLAKVKTEIAVRYEVMVDYECGRPMVAPTEYYGGEGVGEQVSHRP